MKKYLLLFILFMLPLSVNAADSATINITSSKTNVSVGDIITVNVKITSTTPIGYYEYTLDYNSNKLSLTSGKTYNVDRSSDSSTKSINKKFKFKILNSGSSKISVKSYAVTSYKGDKNLSVKVNPVQISTGSTSSYSSNNYLNSLEVEGYKLSPSFDKKTSDYKVTLNKDANKIKIIAKADSSKATVIGDGEFEITSGINKFEILVNSEQGSQRKYTIEASTGDISTISVNVDGKTYTLTSDINALDIPEGYKTKKITIDNHEVTALYNAETGYTLVGLMDENNNVELYLYDSDKNTYTLYKEVNIDNIPFIPIDTDEVPLNYTKCKITIGKTEMNCFKLVENATHFLIYGKDINSGVEGWYSYNSEDGTFHKYNFEIDDFYNKKIKNTQVLIYILAGTTFLFGIGVIVLVTKKNDKISITKKKD